MKVNEFLTCFKNAKIINKSLLEKFIFFSFKYKYYIDQFTYGTVVINNIIYNEKSHIVATFKDYLISDDISEFLKRYYNSIESSIRLPKFYEYYETYSRIYPNYTILPEAKYIYKNIHKKQRMIDQQQVEESKERKKDSKKVKNNKKNNEKDELVFNTEIYNSIVNKSEDLYNLLFGINKNFENSEKTQEDFNKIIKEIKKSENQIYNDISYENDNLNHKNNIKKINNNKNTAGKLFQLCGKNMNTITKNNRLEKNKKKNLFKDIQLINSNSHKKTLSVSTGNSKNKKTNKNSKDNQSFNNIYPYYHRKKSSKGEINEFINKIKVNINININTNPNNYTNNSSIGKGNENEKLDSKNNLKVLKNKIYRKRNKNSINAKTNFTSHTNSISKNITLNNTTKINIKKNKYRSILSPKANRIKKEERINDNLLNSKDFFLNNNSTSSSLIREKLKKIARITHSFNSFNNNSSSRQNTNNTLFQKVNYKTISHKTCLSNDRSKNNDNVNYTQYDFKTKIKKLKDLNSKILSNKKKLVKGIQIKDFNKILGLCENLSPNNTIKVKSNRNSKNKNNCEKIFPKPKTARGKSNIKI